MQTLEELIAVGERLAEQLSAITHSDENIERQREKIAALRAKAEKWADKIHTLREKASKGMSKSIASTLTSLGMPEAQFIVEVVDAGELMPRAVRYRV